MRRPKFATSREAAVALLAGAPLLHLCGGGAGGRPVLTVLPGVVVDGSVYVLGSPEGALASLIGRPVVVSTEDAVAALPGRVLGPKLASPVTTLFRAVQVHGVLEVAPSPLGGRVLEALMQKLEPERSGAASPAETASVQGLLVGRVSLERIEGEASLAQDRSTTEQTRLLEHLWSRGDPGDPRAIELIREANPALPPAPFLAGPSGGALNAWLPRSRVEEAVDLVAGEYWNVGRFSRRIIREATLRSTAWVGATDSSGRLIATARAISDGSKHAWIYDVGVASEHRRSGWGRALLRLLLDHPAIRHCRRVLLATKDAQPFYARLGFMPRESEPPRSFPSTEMLLLRETR